jgi:hypothetical protein
VSLDPGKSLSLRLSFTRGSQPLEADGVVVWGEPLGDARPRRYGLRWKNAAAKGLGRIKAMMARA